MSAALGVERRSPIRWMSIDADIQDALDRQQQLFDRWRDVQQQARVASERIAQAEREGQTQRAQALADGRPDPAPPDLAEAEAEAARAGDAARALEQAYAIARERALTIATDYAPRWERLATKKADEAARRLAKALETAESAYTVWREAQVQVELSRDASKRGSLKRRRGPDIELPAIRSANGSPFALAELLGEMRAAVAAS